MAAYPNDKRMKLALTPLSAIIMGAGTALACMVMPSDVLEVLILDTGVPALLPAAAPPLGWTARTAMAMIAGGGVAALTWVSAWLLLGGDGVVSVPSRLPRVPRLPSFAPLYERMTAAVRRPVATDPIDVPVLRRADAHPDAPARAPLLATRDLGVPFLDVRAPRPEPIEQNLPRDLDAPLSAFDPHAIPAAPATPTAPVTPLQPTRSSAPREEGERFEAFELRPPIQPPLDQPPIAAPRTDASIHALLDRLERGVVARKATAGGAVDDALGDLRRLATR